MYTESGDLSTEGLLRHLSLRSATGLVVANIIGTGIFTTTGFQAAELGHPGWIFTLWAVGGVLAFCGAVCYGELGAAIPRAGGEYAYLSRTYGGVFGFMSAFVSLVAGFSAPVASATKALVRYLTHFFPMLDENPLLLPGFSLADAVAVALVWILVGIQLAGVRQGIRFANWVTVVKVAGIVAILLGALIWGRGALANLTIVSESYAALGEAQRYAALGTSLIFVMFCYSGWNASAYLAGEFERPQSDLPRSLLLGTALVLLLYLGLNAVYFYGADVHELAGKAEVGLVAARHLFGDAGATFVTLVLCVSLLASASAMTIAGPRVYYALGRDYPLFAFLGRTRASRGTPVAALLIQGIVTSGIILTGSIDQIMQYAGFTLTLFASLAVSCVLVLRIREPELERPFRTWGYPVTPLLFLGVSGWMMFWAFRGRPVESSLALLTVFVAGLLFVATGGNRRRRGSAAEPMG